MAPEQPSAQDQRVAAEAAQMSAEARAEKRDERAQEKESPEQPLLHVDVLA